ncbi:MAG: DNA polymerase III subunit delta [Clostridium sp.]
MIKLNELNLKIDKKIFDGCYILGGVDENLIKDSIKKIVKANIDTSFKDLNYIEFDGESAQSNDIVNACETMPFMSEKKVVMVYRCKFLRGSANREEEKIFEEMKKYIANIPSHCILIMYYLFSSDKDKINNKLKSLDKKITLVSVEKLRGSELKASIKKLFDEREKKIEQSALALFCNEVDNNMEIIKNEVDKLCSYTEGRTIITEDIGLLMPQKPDSHIFDLIDYIGEKRLKNALDVLDEILFKGEKWNFILSSIGRRFEQILNIKIRLKQGKNKDVISSEMSMHPYVCEKLILQSRKFADKNIVKILKECLVTEGRLKSQTIDERVELEILLINIMTIMK